MRGQAFFETARRYQLADRHDDKFRLYPLVCTIVDKFMRGAREATIPHISMKQFNLLKTFYGITIDPGPQAVVSPLHHKGKTMYAPRPKEYRKGTPIIMVPRYRRASDKTTAKLRTLDEAVIEDATVSSHRDSHISLMDRGWILVALFKINPYIGE